MIKLRAATQIYKMLIQPFLFEGMVAVDCTTGNGHDTLFLAQQAGVSGRVYGFDVQASAIESTKVKINDYISDGNTCAPVELFHTGHENLELSITEEVDVVVYNLGYLPRHDKSITTMTASTIQSVKQAMAKLKNGGVISIIAYPGHAEGANELNGLTEFLSNINQKEFDVLKSEFINQQNTPPVLIMIEKR